MSNTAHIRNFCIIAHIDHGKSTLADRLLELTETISERDRKDQILDSMELERERGITIKLAAVRMKYKALDGQEYVLNLIDTPGHVDFSYEVSRSLAACEGCLLVVDASQGMEAQTLANAYLAIDHNLTIIPVLNKIDIQGIDVGRSRLELCNFLGCEENEVLEVSAKVGTNTKQVLESIVKLIPPPTGNSKEPLKALIFDSFFDVYHGAVMSVRVKDGILQKGDDILLMSNQKIYDISEVGIFSPVMKPVQSLSVGEVGYVKAGIKRISDTKIGDTMTLKQNPAPKPLPGYKEIKPMVFAGLYPADDTDYEDLRVALEKMKLNDAALHYEPEVSEALGFGFRCGFLGLLHMEIVRERLEREYELSLVTTAPNVIYRVRLHDGQALNLENPSKFPESSKIASIEEPIVEATILTPNEFVGPTLKLLQDKRGTQRSMEYLSSDRVMIIYELPLNEIVIDFYDKLKSFSRGYASLDYEFKDFKSADLVKLDILINSIPVDALSSITHRSTAYYKGQALLKKLRKVIPRQMFEVALQAAIGGRIIARENVKALRKNVTAKCYGGDITRKRKLLERQREGKRRMKQIGQVEIPQEAFMAILTVDE